VLLARLAVRPPLADHLLDPSSVEGGARSSAPTVLGLLLYFLTVNFQVLFWSSALPATSLAAVLTVAT
jgi:hypothetical protein